MLIPWSFLRLQLIATYSFSSAAHSSTQEESLIGYCNHFVLGIYSTVIMMMYQ